MLINGPRFPPDQARAARIRERLMDELIKRELLAEEAERLGFRVGEEEVEDMLAESKILGIGGYEQVRPEMQKDGTFHYDTFTKFAQYSLGLTPKAFIEEQRKEMLASRVRTLLLGGVNVSTAEVKDEWVRNNTKVNLEYLRVSWRSHENEVDVTDADIEAHAKANEKKLKEQYDQQKFLYENAPKERRLRQILVKLDANASPEATKAAEKKAQALADRITKKGEAFAAVAKAASDDANSKKRGGDIGWKRQGATVLGAAIEEKAWAAKDGELVGPIKGNDGFYLVLPEASREGNLAFEKVRLDLAEAGLRGEKAKARAKTEAEAALAKAKAAKDKPWKELFPAPSDKTPGAENTPRGEETGAFARRGSLVEGIGTAPELAKAAFELKKEEPFAGPFEVAGSYIVVRLKERQEADMAEFDKKKAELVHEAAAIRGEGILADYTQRRCTEAKDGKKIRVNLDLLRYGDNPQERVSYEPCTPARF